MEGLSHGLTSFTLKVFFACYAMSNVIIWNDKSLASDEFNKLMNKLKTRMEHITKSNNKPAFIYLLRDTLKWQDKRYKSFNEYINKHECNSLNILRNKKLFNNINGYLLRSRPDDKPFDNSILNDLINQCLKLSKNIKPFASTKADIIQQIGFINVNGDVSVALSELQNDHILRYVCTNMTNLFSL